MRLKSRLWQAPWPAILRMSAACQSLVGNVVITGTSPDAGQSYRILTTTNLALPLASWTPVATNVFVGAGFTNSIPMNPANLQEFYRVVEP